MPSTRLTRWPRSRPTQASGSTSTARTGHPLRPTPPLARCSPACTAPTPCASTRTSGSTFPVDCSALLLHDATGTARAFGAGADEYVRVLADQPAETFAFWDHGLELSRRFRALKLWAALRFYGARRLAAAIGEDIRLAAHLAELVAAADDFELLAGPGLSICCFRHAPPHVDEAALDAHNERILQALQRDGRVYLSNATVDGRFALRACITNFRTTRADVERVLAVVRELAG